MIYVDSAVGSRDLVEPLTKLGLPVTMKRLDSADVAFTGRGVGGAPLQIGIEVKTIGDLVSSLQTERLQGHQLLKMVATYDRSYLIVEGDFGHDAHGSGTLFRKKRTVPMPGVSNAVALEQRMLNLQTRGGLIIRHVRGRRDTHRVLTAWYRYWSDRDLDSHKSHLALYAPDFDSALKAPISDFRYIVARIEGIGYEVSGAVEEYFGSSLQAAMKAKTPEWAEILVNGKKLGEKRAGKIVKALERVWRGQ